MLPLQIKREDVREAAEKIYRALQEKGIDVLLDDRDERVGSKFKDSDLLGSPVRIAIGGKGLDKGVVEVRSRRDTDSTMIPIDDIIEETMARLESAP